MSGAGSGSGSGSGGGCGTDEFGHAVARVAVAQMLEVAGFNAAHQSALDALADVALRYIVHLGRSAVFHAEIAGRTNCNAFDVVQGLEDAGAVVGFAGAAACATGCRCLASSGAVRDVEMYLSSEEEVPFARAVPSFPVPRLPPKVQSFAQLGKAPDFSHIPEWLPVFPDQQTYAGNRVRAEEARAPREAKFELARKQQRAENSLLSLQRVMALAGRGDSSAPTLQVDAKRDEEVVGYDTGNPFLDPPLPYGVKDVAQIGEPDGEDSLERPEFPVLEAFSAVIEVAKSGNLDNRVLPKDRPKVQFRIGVVGKSVVAELSSRALDRKKDVGLISEDQKDDKRRKVEMILKEAMENPHELTQL